MKLIVFSALILLLFIGFAIGDGIFFIIPQPIELEQILFLLITAMSFFLLIVLHLVRAGEKVLYLFFITSPFLSQSVNYLNIFTALFIITPPFLFLIIHFFLTPGRVIAKSLFWLFLFCSSIVISVIVAENPYTALAFFILGVGSFTLLAYLVYQQLIINNNPVGYLRGIILSILTGSVIYLIVEVVVFRIRPVHIPLILMRRWEMLPMGRFITGGYREPAGLGFVYSLLFFLLLFYLQSKTATQGRRSRTENALAFVFTIVMIVIVGTRSAILNLLNIFIVFWIFGKIFGVSKVARIKTRYIIAVFFLATTGAFLLLPRTILTSRSAEQPSWIDPIYVQIAGTKLQVVGSTGDYVKHTENSLRDFIQRPLGSGPLNATPIHESEQGGFGAGYYYSIISNLIVIGATFGWLSLALWLIYICHITLDFYSMRGRSSESDIFVLSIILLATIVASLLPGSPFFGPGLNWGGFDRFNSISPSTRGLPYEYPSILSGFIVGALAGFLSLMRSRMRANKIHFNESIGTGELFRGTSQD